MSGRDQRQYAAVQGEQRTHTLLVFMNDVPKEDGGGHLSFPNLGLQVLPRAGDAVLWPNLRDGKPDPQPGRLDRATLDTACRWSSKL